MLSLKTTFLILLFFICTLNLNAQQRVVNQQSHAWISLNTTARFTNKWGMVADLHERRNNFLKDASFHFVRTGIQYWITDQLTATLGYAHLWAAPSRPDWTKFANENRIYQQLQYVSKFKKISLLQRLRNEQRWQQKIVNDKASGENKFTNRIRYLFSATIPMSKNPNFPSLVISDELCIQFGKDVVFNRYDQNRFFAGLRQRLSNRLSFDMGYMFLEQQKASGYQFDHNHTFRWFFYYTPDFRKTAVKK